MEKLTKYLCCIVIIICVLQSNSARANDCDRTATIEEDSLQLVALYNSLDGPNWTVSWDLNTPISTWYGITLTNNGAAVFRIELANNNLTGTLPLLSLPNLHDLDLKFNNISGELPQLELPSIYFLLLASNDLSGPLQDYNYSNLGQLDLSNNMLSGAIPDFSMMPKLNELNLSKNELIGNIPDFSALPLLRELTLYNNSLTGNIPNFSAIPLLEYLQLSGCELEGPIPDFNGLSNLDAINLSNNNLTGTIPVFNFPILRSLEISSNQLEGTIPIFNTPMIQNLDLSDNQLSGELPNFSYSDLNYFSANFNNLTGALIDFDLPSLSSLLLLDNQFSGTIPSYENLPSLQRLWIAENFLGGEIPNFDHLPLLNSIVASENLLSGELPNFENCPLLQELQLSNNQLSGPLPDYSNFPLNNFYVRDNDLSGCIPAWICDVNNYGLLGNDGLPESGASSFVQAFCENPSIQLGVSCNDGNPFTVGEQIQADCTCSNGEISSISGRVFYDTLANCQYDVGELPLQNWIISASKDNITYYGISKADGQYKINVDTGDYVLHVELPNVYWSLCPNIEGLEIGVPNPGDDAIVAIPAIAEYTCPALEVEIATPALRLCSNTNYTLSYCNRGTSMAEDAYAEVTFDPYIFPNASIPMWDSQEGQTLTFNLGDVPVGACGNILINVDVACDSTAFGLTQCASAAIFPDSICLPSGSLWDGSTIAVEGKCVQDSVRFIIENIGTNDMSMPLGYIVIEDDLILRSGSFQIPAGQSDSTAEATTGATYRLEAEQAANHPTNSAPSVFVEGCAEGADPISLGFATIFPNDEADPFISIDCNEVTGPYDPNDKIGYPVGVGAAHLIATNTELEYRIRFQNVGTDTAFLVAIKDTLSDFLNPASIRMGLASHDYTWEIQEGNILYVVFENIMLPDSNVNEVASHGFVKFKINQMADNPPGTQIFNEASIYFDFNAAVVTNTTTHLIEERLIIYDTIYTSYCQHWFYENDTTLEIFSQFDYYDLYLSNVIDIQNSGITYIDTAFTAGSMYEGVVYESDTTLIHHYSNVHGCDSTIAVSLSILTNITEQKLDTQIEVYPNPTDGLAHLILDLAQAIQTDRIDIYNQLGQSVRSIPLEMEYVAGKHVIPLHIETLPKGIYLLSLKGPQIRWTEHLLLK